MAARQLEKFAAARMPLPTILGRSAVCERHSDVARCVAGAKAHQHAAFLVGASGFERLADVTGLRNALSGDFQYHVALLEPAVRCGALGLHLRDNNADLACAVYVACW